MRVSAAKTAQRVERNIYITSKRIKGYGTDNDYPQKVLEIINSSGTGRTCMDIYVKFVEGAGFQDQTLADQILNEKGERANSLLRKAAKDLKNFNGFAFLVKYDGLGMPIGYFNIPFEHCRLEVDLKKAYTGKVAVYPDWTNLLGQQFDMKKVKFIPKYDPLKVIEEMLDAGGPENYIGQIMYFTADGDWEYPISPFDPVITDMLTEESVSTVKHRNAKFNFLPAGILVRKGIKPKTLDDGSIDPQSTYNREMQQSAEMIKNMQGDMNASKIWVVDVDADEVIPEFIPFDAKNYDKEFTYTEESVQNNIGSMFMIPPVLRGVDVGEGFGSELITNAYSFMNSVTGNERRMLEVTFMDMLRDYSIQFTNFVIDPLKYVAEETTQIIEP